MRHILFLLCLLSFILSQRNLNIDYIAEYKIGSDSYSDVWGFVKDGKDYIMIAKQRKYGVSIYEIQSDGTATLYMNYDGESHSGPWSEPRFYAKGGKEYLYIPTDASRNDGQSATIIVDITDPANPTKVGEFGTKSHNIFLHNDLLFTCGTSNSLRKNVEAWDLTDPANPTRKWYYNKYYVHDMWFLDNKMYLAELYNSTFSAYDISNVTGSEIGEDKLIFRHSYSNGFTHHLSTTPDHNYIVVVDEHVSNEHIQFWDIKDPNNIQNLWRHAEAPRTIVHNSFIHNNYIYVSYYDRGLVIYDISDKDMVLKVAEYDTYPSDETSGYVGAWGVYPYLQNEYVAVSDQVKGLVMVKFDQSKRAGIKRFNIKNSVTGQLITDKTITISYSDNVKLKHKETAKGQYYFKGVQGTSYSVTISVDGYPDSHTASYSFTAGTDETIDLLFVPEEIHKHTRVLKDSIENTDLTVSANDITVTAPQGVIHTTNQNKITFKAFGEGEKTISVDVKGYRSKSFAHTFNTVDSTGNTLLLAKKQGEYQLVVVDSATNESLMDKATFNLSSLTGLMHASVDSNAHLYTIKGYSASDIALSVRVADYETKTISHTFSDASFKRDTLKFRKRSGELKLLVTDSLSGALLNSGLDVTLSDSFIKKSTKADTLIYTGFSETAITFTINHPDYKSAQFTHLFADKSSEVKHIKLQKYSVLKLLVNDSSDNTSLHSSAIVTVSDEGIKKSVSSDTLIYTGFSTQPVTFTVSNSGYKSAEFSHTFSGQTSKVLSVKLLKQSMSYYMLTSPSALLETESVDLYISFRFNVANFTVKLGDLTYTPTLFDATNHLYKVEIPTEKFQSGSLTLTATYNNGQSSLITLNLKGE